MGSNGNDHGYAAAVAAAAYAINTLEPGIPDRRVTEPGPQTPPPLEKLKSKAEDAMPAITESARKISKRFTERFLRMKSSSSSEEDKFAEAADDSFEKTQKPPTRNVPEEKTIHPIPPDKRTPTFGYSDQDRRHIEAFDSLSRYLESPPKRPPPSPPLQVPASPKRTTGQEPVGYPARDKGKQRTEVGGETEDAGGIQRRNSEADAWERAELARIKDKYEKLNATILEWEDKKKSTARRKLNEMQERYFGRSDFERKREKAMANYEEVMDRVRDIADGARAQARDKRIKEESKVKEKAIKFRTSGEPPNKYCLCL